MHRALRLRVLSSDSSSLPASLPTDPHTHMIPRHTTSTTFPSQRAALEDVVCVVRRVRVSPSGKGPRGFHPPPFPPPFLPHSP